MKKFYETPELEVSLLTAEDILDGSLDNEIYIPGNELWGNK